MQRLVKHVQQVFDDNDYAFCKRVAKRIVKAICKKHKTTDEQFFNEIFGCTLGEKFRLAKKDGTDKIYKNFYKEWIKERYKKED